MPEYSQVQTYVKCDEKDFGFIVEKYIRMMTELDFDKSFLQSKFHDIKWEISDNGFMYTGCNSRTLRKDFDNVTLNIRPHLLGWTPMAWPSLEDSWLEISLLFETEQLIEDFSTLKFKDNVQNILWDIMVLFSRYFDNASIFLTDEVTDGKPWEAYFGETDYLWAFDAAIIPQKKEILYSSMPKQFERVKVNNKTCYIYKNVWSFAPWHQ